MRAAARAPKTFGQRQDTELEPAERLPDLAGLQLGAGALDQFHERDDGECAIGGSVNRAGRADVAPGRPNQDMVSKIILLSGHPLAS